MGPLYSPGYGYVQTSSLMPPFIFIRFVGSNEVFAHISDTVFKFNQKNASTSASHAWTTRFTVSAVFSFGLAKHFRHLQLIYISDLV